MLKQRVVTAVILTTLFLSVLFLLPSFSFIAFIALFFCLGAWEWANLSGISKPIARSTYAIIVVAVAYLLSAYSPLDITLPLETILYAACCWWALALLWVQSYPTSAVLWGTKWVRAVMGFFVLVPTALSLLYLYSLPHGAWVVVALFLVVAGADIGAYFSGKAFGRRKLAIKVSPGKSWEGVFGGVIFVCIISSLYVLLSSEDDFLKVFAIVLPASAISVLGDLLESMVKRHRGIKDSSQLLPGHGGILDRIDGVTAAAPVFALTIMITGWSF